MKRLSLTLLLISSFYSYAFDLSLITDNQKIKEALSKSLTEKEVLSLLGNPHKKDREYFHYSIFEFKYDLTLKFKDGKTVFVSYSPRKEKKYLRNFPENIKKKSVPLEGSIPHDNGRFLISKYKNYSFTFKNIASKPLYKVEVKVP